MSRPRVLLISFDPVGREMQGPAIRAYELARALAPHADVTLASPGTPADPPDDVPLLPYSYRDPRALRPAIAAADVVVCRPPHALIASWLRRSPARLIVDLYDPEPLESLERVAEDGSRWRRLELSFTLDRFGEALHTGDRFICASERQRDLWLGAMMAERVLRPDAYAQDPTLDSLIGVVPFGIPAEPPRAEAPGPRGTVAGLGPADELILWNGGIWPWLDATGTVEAMALLAERRPSARLVFMGKSPSPASERAAAVARDRASELGVLGTSVLFGERWVPYAERTSWLLEADCALSTHRDHLETRFAFRTRLLDCLWAGLPIVCTRGDELADRVERLDLGRTVAPGDAEGLAGALEAVLANGRGSYSDRIAEAAAEYHWDRAARPLVEFVTSPDAPHRSDRPALRRTAPRARGAVYRALNGLANAVRRRR